MLIKKLAKALEIEFRLKKFGFLQPLKNLGSPQERKNRVDLGSSKKGRITKDRIKKGRMKKG